MLRAPLAIVGSAYSQVLYSEVNTMKINGTPFKPLLIKSIRKIMLICFPFFLVLLFFAPFIFKIAFGDEWEQAGVLTRLLIPWLVMNFLASPISQVPNIMGQQRKAFLINLIVVLAAFAGLILSIQVATSFEYPFLVFSTISALYLIYFVRWILRLSGDKFRI
ncbi:MAG: oligosaccharide flippase family protein [Bacteroidetes bacterium]|nr:oligosaccharide flippase family protein [Bacteroidota bacterium]